ncbi:MAG: hypothetical protein IPL86_15015 [Flavobacteriales bacterium]|nr:hypothetical protein [Flavobacteriales bacterium]
MENAGYSNKVMLFNGSNTDARSKEIHNAFKKKYEGTDKLSGSKTADVRQALVDHFKNSAEVMIATEAAAEGINLQFCSMVINYDLPWNPQRIEQRIGRCHRYGQKHDVVVVNFQNLDNAADRRVLDLLTQKFNLFSGVFGASDEVLGTLESGGDFERKIIAIIQRCRTNEQINAAFDALQKEYETVIDERMRNAQMALTEHFDADVIEKLRTRMEESTVMISKFQRWLWEVSRTFLRDDAQFDIPKLTFQLLKNPFKANIHTGLYSLDKKNEQAYRYRVNHPLAAGILKHYANLELAPEHVTFHYSSGPQNNALISPFKGQSGWLRLSMVEVNSLEQTDHLVFTGYTDSGTTLQQEQVAKLMELQADATAQQEEPPEQQLEKVKRDILKGYRENLKNNDAKHLQQEVNKLNRWAEIASCCWKKRYTTPRNGSKY